MKHRYYKCTVYIKALDDHWDSHCDELAALGRLVNNDDGFSAFEEVSKEEFKINQNKLFDEFGGM